MFPKVVSVCQHTILPDLLDDTGLVIDCGAGVGDFALGIRSLSRASIIGIEADPNRFAKIPKIPEALFINKAIWINSNGVSLNVAGGFCSSAIYSPSVKAKALKVSSTTLEEILKGSGERQITLLKIDIEGAELDVLEQIDSTLIARVRQISVEFHDFINADDLPRIRAILEKMNRLGFRVLKFSTWNYGDILMLNTAQTNFSNWDYIRVIARGRLLPGLKRWLTRKLLFKSSVRG
jgi:FkbM family methyltransferase